MSFFSLLLDCWSLAHYSWHRCHISIDRFFISSEELYWLVADIVRWGWSDRLMRSGFLNWIVIEIGRRRTILNQKQVTLRWRCRCPGSNNTHRDVTVHNRIKLHKIINKTHVFVETYLRNNNKKKPNCVNIIFKMGTSVCFGVFARTNSHIHNTHAFAHK